ncbi:MAG: DUF2809 domain-containing protein [Pedobacter sp.]|nr:MAG: DUF2809 domain-containing protein [Pedobacter sp.]
MKTNSLSWFKDFSASFEMTLFLLIYLKMKLTFNLKFLFIFIAIFIVEVSIAKFLHDAYIRPFGGDVLVVVLIYAFLRIFLKMNYKNLAFYVLIFSFVIEFLQALHYVNWLGLQDSKFWTIVLGTYFSVYDLLAYFVGYLICLLFKD